jgi:hypothetical protein
MRPAEQDRPDIARKRIRWKAHQGRIDASRLVFIDETWIKTNMAPLRGWGPSGQRLALLQRGVRQLFQKLRVCFRMKTSHSREASRDRYQIVVAGCTPRHHEPRLSYRGFSFGGNGCAALWPEPTGRYRLILPGFCCVGYCVK